MQNTKNNLWGSEMIKLLLKTIWLGFVVTSILGGCGREHKKDTVEVLACEPNLGTLGVVPDYGARAIEAAGGFDAWMRTKELQFDCVVTFYQADGSFYLTEQHYDVYPWSNSIRISGREPQGKFVWQFSKGQFSVLQGGDRIEALTGAQSRCFAEVILNVITVPARFLDGSVEFVKLPDPVKVQGQWYYRINRQIKTAAEAAGVLSEAVFYQNRDSSLCDMLWFPRMSPAPIRFGVNGGPPAFSRTQEGGLTVRGYDYNPAARRGSNVSAKAGEEGALCVPARIEIFRSRFGGGGAADSQERLVKIDFY
jgi:hypothetical protein